MYIAHTLRFLSSFFTNNDNFIKITFYIVEFVICFLLLLNRHNFVCVANTGCCYFLLLLIFVLQHSLLCIGVPFN